FERLLAHNSRAKIVWAHAGSTDNYGTRTPALCRRLLAAHRNLYMELKIEPLNMGANPLTGPDGRITPEGLALIKDYPDRFVVGTGQSYPPAVQAAPHRWQAMVMVFNQFPAGLRRKIGIENPTRLYFGKKKAMPAPKS